VYKDCDRVGRESARYTELRPMTNGVRLKIMVATVPHTFLIDEIVALMHACMGSHTS
jgi:hypothetical protein